MDSDGSRVKVDWRHMWGNAGRGLLVAAIAFALTAGAAGALAVRSLIVSDTAARWDPLYGFATQTVLDQTGTRLPEGAISTVRIGEDVVIRGIKCNAERRPVTVRGHTDWQEVEPPGTLVLGQEGVSSLAPGCTARVFHNAMPEAVQARVRQQAAQGHTRTQWAITGATTPVEETREGLTTTFRSTNFTILP